MDDQINSMADELCSAFKSGTKCPKWALTWIIAMDTGWTLEYVESLPVHRMMEYTALKQALGQLQMSQSQLSGSLRQVRESKDSHETHPE